MKVLQLFHEYINPLIACSCAIATYVMLQCDGWIFSLLLLDIYALLSTYGHDLFSV